MKLNFITIFVQNLERSVSFYQTVAGLQVVRRLQPAVGEIAFLANQEGETMLELIQLHQGESVSVKGMVFSFQAKEALEVYREVIEAAGYTPSPIIAQGPKPPHFTLQDPDGICVEIGG